MERRQTNQGIAWFWDHFKRELLDLDPPYQRRSVWNQPYKDYFIDTILLSYPTPVIFLYEEIDENGKAIYHVVDGKQRLTTIFEFIEDKFPVWENGSRADLQGKYFSQLDKDTKTTFWKYSCVVEYLPTNDLTVINNIFDRINRNVAKLTPQELRHAKFDGVFLRLSERLAEWMLNELPINVPRIASISLKQMKDVELVAQLLLFLEEGVKGYSPEELDKAFSDRDVEWEGHEYFETIFKATIAFIKQLNSENILTQTRLRNQIDFYSLFGAISELIRDNETEEIEVEKVQHNLRRFLELVDDDVVRNQNEDAAKYYAATRNAANQTVSRRERIQIIKNVILS